MAAAVSRRRAILLTASVVSYPLIFGAFMLFEKPGLGLGHFYYFPVAMVALASGPFWGAGAGLAATGLWALGMLLNPHLPSSEILTASSMIRFLTYTSMGTLVGWFSFTHAALIDRLRIAGERDFLTGLLNTRAFDAALTGRLEQGEPFGLVLGDLDNMREINDGDGHSVGNDVLRLAGDIIEQAVGRDDQTARIGGDEFAVITSLPSSDTVRALCGRLTAALAEEGISMSFGWAVYPRDGETSLLLFRAADERLHAQKLIRSRLTSAEVVSFPTRAERLAMRSELG